MIKAFRPAVGSNFKTPNRADTVDNANMGI